ncbi:copper amine oxidase N-terminal domain-containing protein [Gorillibacterium massiliense]|uniref:copper amine oxidase N-terminal domain-containing protein n=1 Tax=Gorillibacterium massiliense TaxID=1280390 RepID=UPI0004B87D5E|nr:copper amine oxidase N-terminal domain-containing protein [Gorillibacterium massiliense]
MKKALYLLLSFSLLFCLSSGFEKSYAAQDDTPQIKDIVSENRMLMDDGSVWLRGNETKHYYGNLSSISDYYGVTNDGKLVMLVDKAVPKIVEGQTGVMQVVGNFWLKGDGTVWNQAGQVKTIKDVLLLGYAYPHAVALTKNGDIFFLDSYNREDPSNRLNVSDPASVISIAISGYKVVLLYKNGNVVVYDPYHLDDKMRTLPVTIVQDAVHVTYLHSITADTVMITKKDGSVWRTGVYEWDTTELTQLPQLSQIVKTTGEFDDNDQFYAQKSDGSWLFYNKGEVTPVNAPYVKTLDVSISNLKPYLSDNLDINTLETYSNDAKFKIPATDLEVTIDKPYLLKLQSDGKLKVLGVGQSKVTVSYSGFTKTFTVASSSRENQKYSKLVNGVIFLPIKPVFQALGGTVTAKDGAFDIKLGDTTLSMKTGDKNAKLNGKAIVLKAAPIVDKGDVLFPASLLTDSFGATVKWDSTKKQANISFGAATMTVVSSETASILKKLAQGSLAQYIGKTYWVNYYEGWERFSKVTISDIIPDETGYFIIEFKTSSGKIVKSYSMSSDNVKYLFADSSVFFTYDPYKKYNWSQAIWNQIKAEQISIGMTKDQVRLSWGSPASTSTSTSNGNTIEVWVYSNFDTVSFVNGKVYLIIN